jgi:hypothetical protein
VFKVNKLSFESNCITIIVYIKPEYETSQFAVVRLEWKHNKRACGNAYEIMNHIPYLDPTPNVPSTREFGSR